MSAEKPVLSLIDLRREERRAALIRVDGLHQAAMGRPDFRLTGAGRKAKDLIGLLISHGARIRRAARPRCLITLDVFTPTGLPAGPGTGLTRMAPEPDVLLGPGGSPQGANKTVSPVDHEEGRLA